MRYIRINLVLFYCCLYFSCGEQQNSKQKDTPHSGTIYISADESFEPIINEQIQVYESSNPEAHIIATYKPEAECLKDLLNDSIRIVIVTRGLSQEELNYYRDTLGYEPSVGLVAYDAVAVIVNENDKDTTFTRSELKQILQGKFRKKYQVVFDGSKATSTVRFILDSVLKGEKWDDSVVRAAPGNREAIDYVAETQGSLGLVGVNWIGNPEDSVQVALQKKVRLCWCLCEICPDSIFLRPYQLDILSKGYPFVRGVYYIVKENYKGLGTGFADFMKYERGQLIFRRAYLAPAILPFIVRESVIRKQVTRDLLWPEQDSVKKNK